jgi:hypothetical protein
MLFCIIGLKLSLGTAGIIPSLNIPGGLISFAAIKSLTAFGTGMRTHQRAPLLHKLLFQPFGLQVGRGQTRLQNHLCRINHKNVAAANLFNRINAQMPSKHCQGSGLSTSVVTVQGLQRSGAERATPLFPRCSSPNEP